MSFILDALKKSETDRQRQGGPALFEVKVAAPRSALPPWAIAIAVLFAANLGVVAWLLLRHNSAPAESAQPQVAGTASAAAPSPAPAARGPAASAGPATTAAAPAPSAPSASSATNAAPVSAPPATPRAPPSRSAAESEPNPDDYAPATEPAPSSGTSHVQRGTDSGVPLYQQLAATSGNQLPQLRLDLHAYAEKAEDRWVLVNMHKLHEGDATPEGARVERITPDGAVLSWHGQQFLLTRE
jgi:general secretion pathway protein B